LAVVGGEVGVEREVDEVFPSSFCLPLAPWLSMLSSSQQGWPSRFPPFSPCRSIEQYVLVKRAAAAESESSWLDRSSGKGESKGGRAPLSCSRSSCASSRRQVQAIEPQKKSFRCLFTRSCAVALSFSSSPLVLRERARSRSASLRKRRAVSSAPVWEEKRGGAASRRRSSQASKKAKKNRRRSTHSALARAASSLSTLLLSRSHGLENIRV